jgi:SAM-dependent methyltransferase
MSLRYYAGYSLIFLSLLLRKILEPMFRAVSLPERFAPIIWTPQEIDRYARTDWNSLPSVRAYSRMEFWVGEAEKTLVETYFTNDKELLNMACGAGREALLLARRGLRVTACDWSPRMITEARRRAQEANLSVRFVVADLFDLPYAEHAFDYLLLTNHAYSHLFPRSRRLRFLRQAHSMLKPGGVFIISFARAKNDPRAAERFLQWLFVRLCQYAPFNKDYEPGDCLGEYFFHDFQPEELRQEFNEAKFLIKDWLWDQGYAVLAKG